MSTEGPPARHGDDEVRPRFALNEDWLATLVGLGLLILVLTGVIPVGLVP